jgi:hypothetical protein
LKLIQALNLALKDLDKQIEPVLKIGYVAIAQLHYDIIKTNTASCRDREDASQ